MGKLPVLITLIQVHCTIPAGCIVPILLKLKSVTLGYRIPIKNKKIINYARVYISGENLLMWDKYEGGYSPEVNNDGKNSDYDYGSYPQARTITLGVNVTF